jgi:hypothetical protein
MKTPTGTAPPVTVRATRLHGPDDVFVTWPPGWPPPSVGDFVYLDLGGAQWRVDSVNWYPNGTNLNNVHDGPIGPFVHVVITTDQR